MSISKLDIECGIGRDNITKQDARDRVAVMSMGCLRPGSTKEYKESLRRELEALLSRVNASLRAE